MGKINVYEAFYNHYKNYTKEDLIKEIMELSVKKGCYDIDWYYLKSFVEEGTEQILTPSNLDEVLTKIKDKKGHIKKKFPPEIEKLYHDLDTETYYRRKYMKEVLNQIEELETIRNYDEKRKHMKKLEGKSDE